MSRAVLRPSIVRLIIIGIALFSVWALRPNQVARAAYTCGSITSGPWASSSTWTGCGGGYPGASDDVVINSGHVIDASATTYAVHNIQSWGTLHMGGSFVLYGNYYAYNGTASVTGSGTFNFLGGTGSEMCGGNMTANFSPSILIYFNPAVGVTTNCTQGFSGNLHVGSGTLVLPATTSPYFVRIYNGATLTLGAGVSMASSGGLQIDNGGLLDLGASGSATVIGTLTNYGTVRATRNSPGTSSTTFGLAGGPNNGFVVQPLTGGFSQLVLDWHGEHHSFKTGTSFNRGAGWGEYWVLSVTGSDSARVTIPARFFVPDVNSKVCNHVAGTTWNCAMTSYDGAGTPRTITRNPMTINTNLAFAAGANVAADGAPLVGNPGGNALNFDGMNDYVNIGASSPAFSTDLTVEAWVRTTDNRIARDLVAWGNTDPCIGDNAQFRIDNGVLNFGMHDVHAATCGNYDNGWQSVVAATPINTGDWTHVAMVKSGSAISLYTNSQVVATGSINKALSVNRLAIGSLFYAGSVVDDYLAGDLDEVRVWNSARTAEQIRQNMYRELGGTANLVAVYNFNESSGDIAGDSSGNNAHGTLTNSKGTPWRTSGAFAGPRNALNFDGVDDYVSTINTVSGYSAFTVEAWVNHAGATFATHETIVEFGNDAPYLGLTNGQPEFFQACTSPQALEHNRWYHLAWVKDSATYAIYVDGVQVCTTSSASAIMTGGDMGIGYNVGDTPWTGRIDEVRLWSVARTAEEIRQNMDTALTGAEAGLAAYYRFDQANAADQTSLHDVTTNNRHGTLTNMDASTAWVSSTAFNTWIGSDNTDWADAANWSRNAAPVAADNAGLYDYPLSNAPDITADTNFHSLIIAPNAQLSIAANLTLTGNWISDEGFTQSAGTVTFGGSGSQTLLMSVMGIFNNLTINSGVTLIEGDASDNVVVNDTFTNNGQARKSQTVTAAGPQVFGLTGIDIDVQTQGTLASLQVNRIDQPHAQENASGGGAFILDHYYSITPTGAGYTAEVCADYTDAELGALTEANLRLCRWTGSAWTCPDRGLNSDVDTNMICADNVTTFSDWVIGAVNPTAVTLHNLSAASQPIGLAPLIVLLAALLGLIGLIVASRRTADKRITD